MRKKIMYYCNKDLFEDKKPRNFGKSNLEKFEFQPKSWQKRYILDGNQYAVHANSHEKN